MSITFALLVSKMKLKGFNRICPNGGADPVITRKGRWFFNLITLERAE